LKSAGLVMPESSAGQHHAGALEDCAMLTSGTPFSRVASARHPIDDDIGAAPAMIGSG